MNLNSDIVSIILSLSHPYYNKGFIYCNTHINRIVNNYKYQLLQIWCFPFLPVSQITSKYPNPTLGQIIEASLYYYPIKPSLEYYPKLELLYNACSKGIDNINPFICHSDDKDENNVCSLILYKFKRITQYNMWLDTFFNSLRIISLGMKLSTFEINSGCDYSNILSSFVLSLEETLELLIRLTGNNFYPLTDFGLSLCGQPDIEHLSIAGISMNMILGPNKIKQILERAGRQMKVNESVEGLSKDQLRALQVDESLCPIYSRYLNKSSNMYKRTHWNIEDIEENDICLHALEIGDMLSYITYRDEGYLIPKTYSCWFAPNISYSTEA